MHERDVVYLKKLFNRKTKSFVYSTTSFISYLESYIEIHLSYNKTRGFKKKIHLSAFSITKNLTVNTFSEGRCKLAIEFFPEYNPIISFSFDYPIIISRNTVNLFLFT